MESSKVALGALGSLRLSLKLGLSAEWDHPAVDESCIYRTPAANPDHRSMHISGSCRVVNFRADILENLGPTCQQARDPGTSMGSLCGTGMCVSSSAAVATTAWPTRTASCRALSSDAEQPQ